MSNSWTIITTILGGFATIAIFSFLIKENPFYRFFEHLFIGIAAGFVPIYTIKYTLWPIFLEPMLGLNITTFPDGTRSEQYNPLWLLYIIPMLFGLLYYFIYSRRYGWLAKLVIGFSLGAAAGLSFKGFFAEMIPQLVGSFKPLLVFTPEGFSWIESFNNTLFIITLLSVLVYFFFSFRVESRGVDGFSKIGRWLMMVCFGAFFGSTVMARMALLVERLQFILVDWTSAITQLWA